MTPVILHVAESFGAGTATAVIGYVDRTPEVSHHLLMCAREESVSAQHLKRFDSVTTSSLGVGFFNALNRTLRVVQPTAIHAHSTIAGALVRSSPSIRKLPVFYTPHCFLFERTSLPRIARAAIWCIERLLVRRTAALAACSRREAALAVAMGHRVVLVPNAPAKVASSIPSSRTVDIVGSGRLAPQKDPDAFAEIVDKIRRRRPETTAAWVGAGDDGTRERLEAAGIEVTGWMELEAANARIHRAHVLLHTARWEGFPLVLLEATTAGVPAVVRSIPPFDELRYPIVGGSPLELAEMCIELLESDLAVSKNLSAWAGVHTTYSSHGQRRALRQLYGIPNAQGADSDH